MTEQHFTEEWWDEFEPLGMVEREPKSPEDTLAAIRQWLRDNLPPVGTYVLSTRPLFRYGATGLTCTCVYHFGAGMDMVRTADPDCRWPEHRLPRPR